VDLGGADGLLRLTLNAQGAVSARAAIEVEDPASSAPFDVAVLLPLDEGVLAGGASLAWIEGSEAHVWARSSAPAGVTALALGPDQSLWVGTLVQSFVPLIPFRSYDVGGTLDDGADDTWQMITNDWFGASAGAPVDAIAFYEGCRAVIGNAKGLHHFDCGGTPFDPDDDVVVSGLYKPGTLIRGLRPVAGSTFFLSSLTGLAFLDLHDTADPSDDTHRDCDLPSPSYGFAWDGARLIYFAGDGLVWHDVAGTPGDASDDSAALLPMEYSRTARVEVDGSGGVWFSFGDASGVRRVRPDAGDLAFVPLADALGL